jgi:hypothetical protein
VPGECFSSLCLRSFAPLHEINPKGTRVGVSGSWF